VITIKVLLYTSKLLKNGEHPIMLRVTENRKVKYIGLGFSTTKQRWDEKSQRPNKKHPNKFELDLLITKRIQEVQQVLLNGEIANHNVSADDVLSSIHKKRQSNSFVTFGLEYCEGIKKQGRVKTASSYKEAIMRLTKALNIKDVSFQDLTPSKLLKLESALLKDSVSENSISVYMRSLRAIYNRGIIEGIVTDANYPFKAYKIGKLNNKTVKRAITKEEVNAIINLNLEPGSKIDFSRKVFVFSYYCRGINFRDIALLKNSDIKNGRLVYTRSKTGQNFNIGLLPPALAILEYLNNIPNTGGYVFPILDEFHNTPERIENRLKRVLREINKDLKEIGNQLQIETPLTTYVARHTYATVLKRSGVSTSIISESMGHATEAITQTYLDTFENKVLDDADQALL
jgi:site-specific recombinase XerD